MFRKTVSAIMMSLLALGTLALVFHVQPVWASGTVYIRADGSIDPSTAPIHTADSITYTLSGNITADADGIVIERDNIVLNGAGYAVTGSGSGNGTTLTNMSNVTVNNMTIANFTCGIYLDSSSGNVLSGNNVTANIEYGIEVDSSSNNVLSSNDAVNDWVGIELGSSSNNTLSGNDASNEVYGIELDSSSGNVLSGNNVANNDYGILFGSSSDNTLSGNNVTANNGYGVQLEYSSNNTLSGNNAANNGYGVQLSSSSNNTLSGNVMVGNGYNFFVYGSVLSDFLQLVDTSNLADGKPVYYFVNQSDLVVNADAYPEVGYLGFVNCVNVTVQGLNLTKNGEGLLLAYTNDSNINGNNAADNFYGIWLDSSSNNTLSDNNVTANSNAGIYLDSSSNNTLSGNNAANNEYGVELDSASGNTLSSNGMTANNLYGVLLSSSSGNFIFLNSFVNNTNQASTDGLANVWDNGSMGNYWSDYLTVYPNATEVGSSGVWNRPYVIDANNTDNYPLVNVAMVPEFPAPFMLLMCALACLAVTMASRRKITKPLNNKPSCF